ncbi:MAG: ABC transporter ATP-binding protein [Gemmatimonadota bacterium]
MSSEGTRYAIRAFGLGKRYRTGKLKGRHNTLRDQIAAAGRNTTAWARRVISGDGASSTDVIWALRDVSFDVVEGEAVGIIGSNGAGKSTLLKVLSRVTAPTEGRGEVRGRVGSLLEVGAGFHSELTGRENVFLNGAVLGMKRSEILDKFDEIVAFAGIDRYIDTPVKFYSSGMYLRLAFSVAAHLEPDILVVDEVLAVGDDAFQRRCIARMHDLTTDLGRTVLVVSHDLRAIRRLCDRCVLLDHGRISAIGSTEEVVAQYVPDGTTSSTGRWIELDTAPRRGSGQARFGAVRFGKPGDGGVAPDRPLEFEILVEASEPLTARSLSLTLSPPGGTCLLNLDAADLRLRAGRNTVRVALERLHLRPGIYQGGLWLGDEAGRAIDAVDVAFQVEVEGGVAPLPRGGAPREGVVSARYSVAVQEASGPGAGHGASSTSTTAAD